MLLDDYFAKLASQEKEIKKETEKETKKKPYFSAPAKPASKPEKELTRKQVNSVNWLNDLKKCR
ncbi:MAG: hypothetical protein LBQ86_02705, partial [Holophagales bacterium]|nr:hypothetical protein [Holophagales bacterium]